MSNDETYVQDITYISNNDDSMLLSQLCSGDARLRSTFGNVVKRSIFVDPNNRLQYHRNRRFD